MTNYQLILEDIIKKNVSAGLSPTLLLHCCCAPCSSYVLEYLSNYFKITVFYYNPNISSKEEYDKRRDELKRLISLCNFKNAVTFVDWTYDNSRYEDMIRGLEEEKEGGLRCKKCYRLRLEESAKYAKDNNFDYFTTTLSISPYKNASSLNEIGEELSKMYKIKYLFSDFKKKNGYKRSIELSNIYNLYRQNYCGCIYSKRLSSAISMNIKCIKVGSLEENCYILNYGNENIIVDPGDDFSSIKENIDGDVLAVLITHRHFDHIGALFDVVKAYNAPIYEKASVDEEEYKIGKFSFKVIFTPGHSKDSVTYYFYKEKVMFTGDFLFCNDIGRCDLDGGNFTEMKESIEKIKKYDDDIKIYPGHGNGTSLFEEKRKNIYFNN